MAYGVSFTPRGKRDLKKLPKHLQKRIVKKLRQNAELKDP